MEDLLTTLVELDRVVKRRPLVELEVAETRN
jgi:hypothetical protein